MEAGRLSSQSFTFALWHRTCYNASMNPVVSLLEHMKLSGNPLLPAPVQHKPELKALGLMAVKLRGYWTILPEQVPPTRLGNWTCLQRDSRRVNILASLNTAEGQALLKNKSRRHEAIEPERRSVLGWYPWLHPTSPVPTDRS